MVTLLCSSFNFCFFHRKMREDLSWFFFQKKNIDSNFFDRRAIKLFQQSHDSCFLSSATWPKKQKMRKISSFTLVSGFFFKKKKKKKGMSLSFFKNKQLERTNFFNCSVS